MSSVAEIHVLHQLPSIEAEWWDLLARCPDATPFQSPAWLIPWWNYFARGDPMVIAVREESRLAGLGLFYLSDEDSAMGRQIFLLGKSASDYLDILVEENEDRAQIAQTILRHAFDEAGRWDHADFDRLRPSSPLLQVCNPSGVCLSTTQEGICPAVPLNGPNINDFVKKSTRDAMRKHRNRARGMGTVEFVTADERSYARFMDDLIRLHTMRWNSVGQSGVFSYPNMIRFLKEAGLRLLRGGMLHLQAMLLNGECVAVSFAMLHRERLYFYLCDFDPARVSISPGTLLTAYAMEQAAQRGAVVFDFMQGEEEYKYKKWNAQPQLTYRLRFSRTATFDSADFVNDRATTTATR